MSGKQKGWPQTSPEEAETLVQNTTELIINKHLETRKISDLVSY